MQSDKLMAPRGRARGSPAGPEQHHKSLRPRPELQLEVSGAPNVHSCEDVFMWKCFIQQHFQCFSTLAPLS